MKKFMKTCYKCETEVKIAKIVKEGIALDCLKCPKCGEEYFTSSELIKLEERWLGNLEFWGILWL